MIGGAKWTGYGARCAKCGKLVIDSKGGSISSVISRHLLGEHPEDQGVGAFTIERVVIEQTGGQESSQGG